jgi:Kinesin motor domain
VQIAQLIAFGGRARTIAATNANAASSRSHAIFTITLRQQRVETSGSSGSSSTAGGASCVLDKVRDTGRTTASSFRHANCDSVLLELPQLQAGVVADSCRAADATQLWC